MSTDFTDIPIVDLAPWWGNTEGREALAQEIREICHRVGFFVVVNHQIPAGVVNDVFSLMDTVFDLPLEKKELIDKLNSPHFRGWEGVGSEYTNNKPDMREQIDLWSEHPARDPKAEPHYLRLLGPNQWFPPNVVPEFQTVLKTWFEHMEALSNELVDLLSLSLGLEQDHIGSLFGDECMSLTKLISYPPTPQGHAGVNAHHDTGFLTILAPGQTPGLQIENHNGQWIAAPMVPDSFVINLGEMLQGMTGNYFVATPHRVITDGPRMSAAYFRGPSLHTALESLNLAPEFAQAVHDSPHHSGAGYMTNPKETDAGVAPMSSSYKADVYGEQLWNYFARSYPENMARHHPDI